MSRQLWELMVQIEETKAKERLTCWECFAVIELLAEGATQGIEVELLEELAREHLSQCADCRETLLAQLRRLEAM